MYYIDSCIILQVYKYRTLHTNMERYVIILYTQIQIPPCIILHILLYYIQIPACIMYIYMIYLYMMYIYYNINSSMYYNYNVHSCMYDFSMPKIPGGIYDIDSHIKKYIVQIPLCILCTHINYFMYYIDPYIQNPVYNYGTLSMVLYTNLCETQRNL